MHMCTTPHLAKDMVLLLDPWVDEFGTRDRDRQLLSDCKMVAFLTSLFRQGLCNPFAFISCAAPLFRANSICSLNIL